MATTINTATATMTTVREEVLSGGFFGSLMNSPGDLFCFAMADSSELSRSNLSLKRAATGLSNAAIAPFPPAPQGMRR